MKRLAAWIVFVLALATVIHILVMSSIPKYLTSRAVDTIYSRYDGHWKINALGFGSLRYAGKDTVVRDNPDTVTSFAVLDVSGSPVRIHCVVPPGDNYWSVSLFGWNTDTFFVVNDLEAPAEEFDVILVKEGSLYEPLPDERVVVSPTSRAVMIVRMIVTDRDDEAEIEQLADVQRAMWVKPLEGVVY